MASSDLTESDKERVRTGMCPWCERGPFTMVFGHIVKAHGLDRFAMRDLMGVSTAVSFIDQAVSARRSENARCLWESGTLTHHGTCKGIPKRRSVALVVSQQKRRVTKTIACAMCGNDFQATWPNRARNIACSSECADALRAKAMINAYGSGKLAAPRTKLIPEQIVTIRTLYSQGDVSQADLAKRYGVTESAVSQIVKGKTYKRTGGPIADPLTHAQSGSRTKRHEAEKRSPR